MRSILVVVIVCCCAAAAQAGEDVYETAAVDGGGSVSGRVSYSGTPPVPERLVIAADTEVCGTEALSRALLVGPEGGVINAVINLRDVRRGKPWQEVEYGLGQHGCRFEPHVMLFREGADLHIQNSDRIAHGVRTYGKDSVFNVGHPKFVLELLIEDFTQKISERKAVRIGCDLHPWMKAFIILQEHPYYVITGEDGTYELDQVPPGEYQLELWHETLGERMRRVTVEPGRTTSVDFELGR